MFNAIIKVISGIPSSVEFDILGNVGTDSLFAAAIEKGAVLGVIVAVFLIVKGGIEMSTAGGDANKIKAGKEQVFAAIMGLALIFMAVFAVKFVVQLINSTAGVNIPQ